MRKERVGRALRARQGLLVILVTGSLAAVPGSTAPDLVNALRAARAAHEDGNAERADEELRKLERGPLADHAALLRARWAHEAQKSGAALSAVNDAIAASPPSEVRSAAYALEAQIHLGNDDVAAAFQSQREAWRATRDDDRAALLALEFAQQFEKRGMPGNALQLYRRVWKTWPRSRSSEGAFERSHFLAEATGAESPPAKALLTYADGLRTAYLCEAGLTVYDNVLSRDELDKATRRRAERGRADCLFQRRRYPEARKAYLALEKSNPNDIDAAIRAARSDARAGNRTRAVESLTGIAKRTDAVQRIRCQYLVAVIVREDDAASSIRLFERVERQTASSGLARLARWRLAWDDLQSGRGESAIDRLRPLTRGSLWDIEVQRARYWTAVAKLDLDPEQGRAELGELAEEIPLSYYGLLSADRLGTPPRVEHSFLDSEAEAGPSLPEQRTRWLLEAGFDELAALEVDSWIRGGSLDRSQRMAASALLHGTGDHFRAVRIMIDGFGGAFEQGIDPAWRSAWEYAWPKPFGLEVKAAVDEFDFDPALVYAVMREESTYRPKVESPAGALGLMQIIPPTGDRIAAWLEVDPFAAEELFEPNTNIRFGTYYLKHLLGIFDGSRPLAIAAYNAGPEAVNTWLERDGRLPADAFVDSVPYSETRRYLRKVIRSWRVYQLLYPLPSADAAASPTQP